MRRQKSDFDCGPTAIANALEVLHRKIGLSGLRDLVGTTSEGSDEFDIMRALLAYGHGVDEHKGEDPRHARAWLLDSVQHGRPVLLCVDRWDHWITAIGTIGREITIYDPAKETGGTFVLSFKGLRPRWEAAKRVRGKGPRFYGIGVGPSDTCGRL